jgi:hypothetical protein
LWIAEILSRASRIVSRACGFIGVIRFEGRVCAAGRRVARSCGRGVVGAGCPGGKGGGAVVGAGLQSRGASALLAHGERAGGAEVAVVWGPALAIRGWDAAAKLGLLQSAQSKRAACAVGLPGWRASRRTASRPPPPRPEQRLRLSRLRLWRYRRLLAGIPGDLGERRRRSPERDLAPEVGSSLCARFACRLGTGYAPEKLCRWRRVAGFGGWNVRKLEL